MMGIYMFSSTRGGHWIKKSFPKNIDDYVGTGIQLE
jgi:hypothetical protein